MSAIQVKKVVAVCFLEAAKMTLDHLGEYRLTMSQQGVQGSPDLPRIYGETRRLHHYLQRCASAYQDTVDLDISEADRALLVACCRRNVEAIDHRLNGERALTHDEKQWSQRKRTVLSDWAVELADKPPLLELPLPRLSGVVTEGVRALTTRLHNKIFPSRGAGASMPALSQTQGVRVPSIMDDYDLPPSLDDYGADPVAAQPRGAPAPAPAAEPEPQPILDHTKLRDPRLRTLAGLDARAYARAVANQDHRMAVVILASLLEAAVLDNAIPRRAEFKLASTPDTWNPVDLLVKVMGEDFSPKDRALAYHLFSSRNLLRPSLQLVAPTVVTQASWQSMEEFVQRAFHSMGLSGSAVDAQDEHLPPMLRLDSRSIGQPHAD